MTFKDIIYQTFLENLNKTILAYQLQLNELKESVMNETKRTAGDKHETALAMLQREQSQIAKQMHEAIDAKSQFMQIKINDATDLIQKGSLVKTNHGYFFISVALPKIRVEDKSIIAVSPLSPLGMQLMGKKLHDEIKIYENTHSIESIW